MYCPHCHANNAESNSICEYCGKDLKSEQVVLEGELVDDSPSTSQQSENFSKSFIFTHITTNPILPSCQLSIITFAIGLSIGFKYGFLAFLGFLFFSVLARIFSFFINVRMILHGFSLDPLLVQIISWFVCGGITVWLAK